MHYPTLSLTCWLALHTFPHALAAEMPSSALPLFRVVDLNRGEAAQVMLADGKRVNVKLLEVDEMRDLKRSAVRLARVLVEIDGRKLTLDSGNYRLPVKFAGVQIDCPVTKGYYVNCDPFEDSWGLEKDARLRLWPANSAWFEPGKFTYPARQRWFATQTQIGNEPAYVDGGDCPPRKIYYHSGNDIGGCEGWVEVVSACNGLVVSARGKAMEGYTNAPFYKPHGDYDYVYVLDEHGWFYRYAHLQSIEETVQPGKRIKAGEKIGVLGKEGSSGGWAHLHFDIKALQPSGKWGIQDAYAFLWEAYVHEHNPDIIAVARPHHLAEVGDKVVLDGSRSWSSASQMKDYEWSFTDGSTEKGARVVRRYEHPGAYSEILKVTDSRGRVAYDTATVQVLGKNQTNNFPPTIHAAYAPTFGIRAGDEVTFKVRTFRTAAGAEMWDFGDGSPKVEAQSDGNAKPLGQDGYAVTQHRYAKPGHYIARVERSNERGETAVARLAIEVGEPDKHYVVLRRGSLEAVIVDNTAVDDAILPGHRGGYHGLASLKHTGQQRNIFVPAYAGLNFEHIHDGTTQPREILFEPRFAPMELHAIDDHTAELHQPPTPHWGLESWMRYELLDNGVIEMKFACVPRRVSWKNNYLGLFWANYIDQPESLDIHFLAAPENNWIRGVTPSHGVLATHLSKNDHREYPHDADFPLSLVFNFSKYRYAEPWYFGACRGMAFVQLFRGEDQIRLSQSPSGGGSGNPAWDFQYFLSEPKVGQRYELAMRALYIPLAEGKSVNDSRQEIAKRSQSAAFAE